MYSRRDVKISAVFFMPQSEDKQPEQRRIAGALCAQNSRGISTK